MEKITLRQAVIWIFGLFIGWRWIVIYSVWSNLSPDQTLHQLSMVDRLILTCTLGSLAIGILSGILYFTVWQDDFTLYRKPPNPDKIHEKADELLMKGKTKEADELLDSLRKEREKLKIKK